MEAGVVAPRAVGSGFGGVGSLCSWAAEPEPKASAAPYPVARARTSRVGGTWRMFSIGRGFLNM